MNEKLALLNPFRYRSYYYDIETKLYYLQSRYYDAETGRFINADALEYLDSQTIHGLNLYAYCGNNPVMMIDTYGTSSWQNTWWGKALGWISVVSLAAVAAVLIVPVAIGAVAAGTLAATVMVGAGVGILAGVGGSIVAQGGLTNIGKVNPWSVAISGVIGGVIGAASGVASYGLAQIGQAIGQSLGFALSNVRHISTGIKIAKFFGLTTSTLMKVGMIAGGFLGGAVGGFISNYVANKFVTSNFGSQYTVDNPNYIRSGLLKLFQWLNPLV